MGGYKKGRWVGIGWMSQLGHILRIKNRLTIFCFLLAPTSAAGSHGFLRPGERSHCDGGGGGGGGEKEVKSDDGFVAILDSLGQYSRL